MTKWVMQDPDGLDPALLRGLTQERISRRQLLGRAGMAAGALGAGAVLSACGVSGSGTKTGGASADAVKKFWAGKKQAGQLDFASWPLYIDVNPKNKNDHPSLDLFTKRTGIKVKYQEVIQDDDSFFGKIQPVLASGQATGYDLMIITNGRYLTKLIQLGYLIPLDHSKIPNFSKYAGSKYKDPSYDPGNAYTVPWQSGFTGIGYDPKLTGREITSYWDLFDPKFKGKVGMFGDTEDLPSLALVAMGVDPAKSKPSDWKKAAAKLTDQKKKGIVRKYYQQDYVDPLSKGDIWLSMAWSGDIFQANASGANLKFVIPKEGGVIWTDNLCIPKHASHPVDAIELMNFVYQPKIAAMIAEGVNYITPVATAKQAIEADARAASGPDRASLEQISKSPLIFPSAADYAKVNRYPSLDAKAEREWNQIFEPVYQS